MEESLKKTGLGILIAAAAMLFSVSAYAFTVTVGGKPVAGEGLTTLETGATVTNFNSNLILPSEYTGGLLVIDGSVPGEWASPPGDNSNYYTVGNYGATPGKGTLILGSLSKYFGFYGGSPDNYNYLDFYNNGALVGSFTGTELYQFAFGLGAVPAGDQLEGAYWNFLADSESEYFNKVVFGSTTNAFETDNHAVLSAVPIPAAVWLFSSGLLGLIGFSKRKKVA